MTTEMPLSHISNAGARPTARLIAVFIDYLLLLAISLLTQSFVPLPDLQGVVILLASTLYFTICGSFLLHGQSVGKRIFGMQVVRVNGDGQKAPSLALSFARYFLNYGTAVYLAELVPLLMRKQEIVAAPSFLEIHMLLALFVTVANAVFFLGSRGEYSLADLLCQTRVISLSEENTTQGAGVRRASPLRLIVSFALSAIIACLLWFPGIDTTNEIAAIARNRYLVESRHQLRIYAVEPENTGILVSAVSLQPFEPVGERAKAVTETFLTGLDSAQRPKTMINFHIEFLPSKEEPYGTAINFSVNPADMTVSNIQ